MIWSLRRRALRAPTVRFYCRSAALNVESLEDRSTPASFTANAFGGGTFAPFDNFTGEVRSASGDVNGDGVADIITAQGPGTGSGSRIRIFDGAAAQTGQSVLISDFYAYSNVAGAGQTPGFAGGVFVAAADFNGDGFAEVVTSPGAGASGHVKVFDFSTGGAFAGNNPTLRTSFFAYPGYLGEVRIATLGQGGNSVPYLVTASGAGSTQSDIRLYQNALGIGSVAPGTFVQPVSQTFPYPGYLGGISIAGGNSGQLFVAPITGQSQVSVFSQDLFSFGAATLTPGTTFQTGFTSPTDVRLGTADVNGDGVTDVLTSSVGATSATPISAFSLNGGVATPLSNVLTGFQGFGMFGGAWLASSAFTGSSLSTTGTTGSVGLGSGFGNSLGQGLIATGGAQGLQAGGSTSAMTAAAISEDLVIANPINLNAGSGGPAPSQTNSTSAIY